MQTIWKTIETTERKNILTNDLELHIIEMMKKTKEVAKKMKEKDIAIEVIEEVTGLTKEEIEKL